MAEVLICGRCGGPLPRPEPGARFVTCRFCDTTSDLHTGERTASADKSAFEARLRIPAELAAFERVFAERVAGGEPSLTAFRGAAGSELGAVVDADALTNVVFGIAADFRLHQGADVTADAQAMQRIALAYLNSLDALATSAVYTINLPFLTATSQGPLHFIQDVTLERLRELAATPASVPAPHRPVNPPPPVAPSIPPPVAPRPWWKKILG